MGEDKKSGAGYISKKTRNSTTATNNMNERSKETRKEKAHQRGRLRSKNKYKDSRGWAPPTLTKKDLLIGIKERKCRMTYKDEFLEVEGILNVIKSNSIELTDCFDILREYIKGKIGGHKRKNTMLRKTKEDH